MASIDLSFPGFSPSISLQGLCLKCMKFPHRLATPSQIHAEVENVGACCQLTIIVVAENLKDRRFTIVQGTILERVSNKQEHRLLSPGYSTQAIFLEITLVLPISIAKQTPDLTRAIFPGSGIRSPNPNSVRGSMHPAWIEGR